MEYLPTLTPKVIFLHNPNVGKYSIHGSYGNGFYARIFSLKPTRWCSRGVDATAGRTQGMPQRTGEAVRGAATERKGHPFDISMERSTTFHGKLTIEMAIFNSKPLKLH